jgi:hypothetical protein
MTIGRVFFEVSCALSLAIVVGVLASILAVKAPIFVGCAIGFATFWWAAFNIGRTEKA